MRFLRFAALVGLTVWVGGLVTLGALVAPTAFAVVAARHVESGRWLVGVLFAALLHRFTWVALGAGALVLVSLLARRLIGPRPVHFGIRLAVLSAMLAVTLFFGFVLLEQVEQIQNAVGVPSLVLPPDHPDRVRFNRLHGWSVVLVGFNVAAGLVLVAFETRDA